MRHLFKSHLYASFSGVGTRAARIFVYIRLMSVGQGDKNCISTYITSVYAKILSVLFGTASSWILTHSPAYELWAANLLRAISFQAINPLCDRHGLPSLCSATSSCIWLCISAPCLNSPSLPSSSVQRYKQFFFQVVATAVTSFLNSDFTVNSGSLMKGLSSSRQWCTKIPFFHDSFPWK